MPQSVRPLSFALGAEIAGVDLAEALGNAEFDPVHRPFLERGILPELVKKIADEAVRAAATEGAKSVVAQQGGDVVASTPAEFAAFIDAELKRCEAIVREAGMTVE